MKIYISADIEGITGVTNWDETDLDKAGSEEARKQMTAEVAAACRGAIQGGADEVWVKDAHWTGRNIIAASLPQETRLIRGWSGHPFMMVEELDESFAALVLIGYHSRAGSGASPLAHTMSGSLTYIKINDSYASEFLVNAYTAAMLKVPLAFVSGDRGLCEEIAQFHPHIQTVAVKWGTGDGTNSLHPEEAVEQIRSGVTRALESDLALCQVPLPGHFRLEVRYRQHASAYSASFYPEAQKLDDHTILYENDSFFEILRYMHFAS
jgi:D-amino peptidase